VEEITNKDGNKIMVSKETGKIVEWTSEDNYKFRLGETRTALLHWLESNPDGWYNDLVLGCLFLTVVYSPYSNMQAIIPKSQYNNIILAVKDNAAESLADLSVSRPKSRLSWGISVPDDEEHVVYVWLDALTNYLTATGYPWEDTEASSKMSAWPADYHIVGKDIIK
jgi:methionyl-tRNA synthetase